MTEGRWARIDSILNAALVRPAEAREAFVREACRDDSALADEVLSMLAHAGSSDDFLEPAGADAGPLLTPGQALGRYTIVERIGRGGMGEVYRARDLRPPREIAIKVLPPEFATDSDRLRRFEHEARAAAALNHPNIVTLHSVEYSDQLHFLTMELVEGQALSAVIPTEGLPLDRLFEVAIQLADAVGAAHERGIVHRDLKPLNVMVTPEGRVKVLDFGLAKLRRRATPPDQTASGPAETTGGLVLGTVAYMSPEQAEGREVDHRSDIFSLGVMFYELAIGQRPFAGETSVSLLSSILRDTPKSVDDVRPALPAELGRMIRRCLMKEPGQRYQSAIDLRSDLEDLKQNLIGSELAARSIQKMGQLPLQTQDSRRTRPLRWVAWIGIGVASLATVALVYLASRGVIDMGSFWRQPAAAAHTGRVQFTITIPESFELIQALAMSPNGTQLAFTGKDARELWVYDVGSMTVRSVKGIVGTAPLYPFWSPDGRHIAYFQNGEPGALWRIPAEGGIPYKICDLKEPEGYGGSWNVENTIVFAQMGEGIFRVAARGGTPARVTTLDSQKGETGHRWPNFLPDGQHFTYTTFAKPSAVYVGSLDPHEPSRKLSDTQNRAIGIPGFLLTTQMGTLRLRELTRDNTLVEGEPILVAEDVEWTSAIAGDRLFTASPTALAYSAANLIRPFQLSVVDRNGDNAKPLGAPFSAGNGKNHPPSLSHSGRTAAFIERSPDNLRWQVRLLDLVNGAVSNFTTGTASYLYPIWAPNDDSIVFTKQGGGGQDLYVKRLDNSVETRIGETSIDMKRAEDWHSGEGLLFRASIPPSEKQDFWLVGSGANETPRVWLKSVADHFDATFSRDGQWVAYASNESGREEIYVSRFPSRVGKRQVSFSGGRFPDWDPNGKSLFFREGDSLMQVDLELGAVVVPSKPRKLFRLDPYGGFAVHPDGKRFVLQTALEPVPRMTITVVFNWRATLKR